MKFLSVSPWIVLCLAAVALGGGLKVPGESPIEFCNYDRDDDLLDVQKIDIAPNPPKPYAMLPPFLFQYPPRLTHMQWQTSQRHVRGRSPQNNYKGLIYQGYRQVRPDPTYLHYGRPL